MTSARTTVSLAADLLVARFSNLAQLADHERQMLRIVEKRAPHAHRPGDRLCLERSEMRGLQFILSGWACRVRQLSDGRRQIMSILLPGDPVGLCAHARPLSPTSVIALSPLRTAEAPEIMAAWRDPSRTPGLSAALDLIAAEDVFLMLGHIMRLGRQTAYERVANFFMEMQYRLSSRDLAVNGSFPMPMSQETLADTVGLSVVHVNRTLQQMRREGLIELKRGRLSILKNDDLAGPAEFTPPICSAAQPVHHPRGDASTSAY